MDVFVWDSCKVATDGRTENSYTVRMKSLLDQIAAGWQRRALVLKAGKLNTAIDLLVFTRDHGTERDNVVQRQN